MYVLLTGTKKNAGDFLIAHAAGRLIERFAPKPDFVSLPAWLPVDEHLEQINRADALVLCGGPAYQAGFGSTIYPLLPVLDRIKVPILSMGLGWKQVPGDRFDASHFRFSPAATPLLDRVRRDFPFAGCRDGLTHHMLMQTGIDNALMTGCPAWYDPDYFDRSLQVPPTNPRVVVTPPESPALQQQGRAVLQKVRELFPDSALTCAFHRGWTVDQYTPEASATNARELKDFAEQLQMEAIDISGGADGINGYDAFDLHVGYRVHGHLKMLSMRKPSFLLAEDGRGRALQETLGLPPLIGLLPARPVGIVRSLLANQRNVPRALVTALRTGAYRQVPDLAEQLAEVVHAEQRNDYAGSKSVFAEMDRVRGRMLAFLRAWPG